MLSMSGKKDQQAMKDLGLSVEEKSIYRVDLSCFFEAAYEVAKKIQEHISE
jgi:hypothetical protein